MGAQVVLTRSDVAKGHPTTTRIWRAHRRETPARISSTSSAIRTIRRARVRHRPGNPAQMDGDLDAIVFGLRQLGHDDGLSAVSRSTRRRPKLILADPVGSILAEYINDGSISEKSASWMVKGIGEDFLPAISDFSRVKKAYAITDKESFLTARELLEKEGILGRLLDRHLLAGRAEILPARRPRPSGARSSSAIPGNKYLSKMYNDYWMLDKRLPRARAARRPARPDPAPVLAARHGRRRPGRPAGDRLPAHEALRRLAAAGDGRRRTVGIVDESDVLLHVYGDERASATRCRPRWSASSIGWT
jgi:cystathionine beta-synthase